MLAILSAVYLLVTGWNLGVQHISGPDEPRYAVAARTMLEGGDLIVPMFNQHPHLEKPVLFHWLLVAAGFAAHAVGLSLDLGFRFEPLIMGLLSVIGLYLLAARLLNPRGACVAALILITSFQFHNVARELVIDMTLSCFLLWSWLFFRLAEERLKAQRSAMLPLLGYYLCLGLACMSKGPFLVGIFSVVPLLVYLWWSGQLALLARAGIWWGAPLSLALGLSWFVALHFRSIDSTPFFATENLERFFGQKDHIHILPFFFYIISMPEIFAPWFLLFPLAAWWTFKTLRARRSTFSNGAKLAASALGVGFLIMSLSGSKRHLYLMPLFPFVALWVAWYLERQFLTLKATPGRGWPLLLKVLGVLLFAGAIVAAFRLPAVGANKLEIAWTLAAGIAAFFALYTAAHALKRGNCQEALARALALTLVLAFVLEAVARPIHERALNLDEFYNAARTLPAGNELVIMGTNSNEAAWYVRNTRGQIDEIGPRELKARCFDSTGTTLLIAVSYLNQSPQLKHSLTVLSPPVRRNHVPFILAIPDVLHPPDASVFDVRITHKQPSFINTL